MQKLLLVAMAMATISGCSVQPQYAHNPNPTEFILDETIDILDFEFVQGEYREFGTVEGHPTYVNKHGGAAVVGSLSGNHISSHIILVDGKACASTWFGISCSSYEPKLIKQIP